jgi:hypothetical protein
MFAHNKSGIAYRDGNRYNTTMDQLRHLVARDYPTMMTGCPRVGFISVIANQSVALLSTCSGQFLLVGNAMWPWKACLHVPYAP